MDNLRTLFNNKQYELIVSTVKNPVSGEEAFLLVNSYIQLGKYKDAVKSHLENISLLWSFSPEKCMDLLFDLRFTLKQFDEAYEDLEYFKNLPYVNQSIEEKLRAYKQLIRSNERSSYLCENKYSVSSIKKQLKEEKDNIQLLMLLDYVSKNEPSEYVNELSQICANKDLHDRVKIYALLTLVLINYDKEITLKKADITYNLVPKNARIPFHSNLYNSLVITAGNFTKNTAILNIFKELLGEYQISIYPEMVEDQNTDLIIAAILSISSEYLKDEIDKNDLIIDTFTSEQLDNKIEEIKQILKSADQLKL